MCRLKHALGVQSRLLKAGWVRLDPICLDGSGTHLFKDTLYKLRLQNAANQPIWLRRPPSTLVQEQQESQQCSYCGTVSPTHGSAHNPTHSSPDPLNPQDLVGSWNGQPRCRKTASTPTLMEEGRGTGVKGKLLLLRQWRGGTKVTDSWELTSSSSL